MTVDLQLSVDRATGQATPPWPNPDLRLVEDNRAPAPMLDDDALPGGWADWIAMEAAGRGCPRDYIAAALIIAASALIGNSRHIAATEIWTEPPHLWLALIGAPSTGKSPALRPIVEAMRAMEREVEPAWQEACAHHAALVESAHAMEEKWKTAVRQAAQKDESPPHRPPGADALPKPLRPRLAGCGRSGLICSHSSSVRSVG